MAPRLVPMASAIMACLIFLTFPFSSIISVLAAAPISVPIVLKISMKTRANIVIAISNERRGAKSICRKVGLRLCGEEIGANPSGMAVTPSGMPTIVQMAIL